MLNLSVALHHKNQGYEIRAIISFNMLSATPREREDALKDMHHKLEQVLPGSFKAKYNIVKDELLVSVRSNKASEATSIHYKLEDFIKSAASSLKLR